MKTKEFIFGTWQLGGSPSFHDMSESDATGLLEYAYNLGIRTFDSAPIYGMGRSEIFIGKALKSVRKDIRIITKFGYSLKGNMSSFDVSPHGIESQLQESLDRLKTDSIDTYLLHIPEKIDAPEPIIACLNEQKKKGYIHAYGLSNTSGSLLEAFLKTKESEVTVIQDFYNVIDRSIESSIFPLLPGNIEFMAYSPLYRGGLTESSMADILKKDESALNMLFRNQGLKSFIRDRNLYETVAKKMGISLKEFALTFLMKQPQVSSIVYGSSQKEHLSEIYSLFQKISA